MIATSCLLTQKRSTQPKPRTPSSGTQANAPGTPELSEFPPLPDENLNSTADVAASAAALANPTTDSVSAVPYESLSGLQAALRAAVPQSWTATPPSTDVWLLNASRLLAALNASAVPSASAPRATPPVIQAATVHAQFETIHPFADGNGRVGRAFVYTVLRRRGEIGNYIPPVSLILAAEPKAYVGGLTGYRLGGVSAWLAQFADATARAAIQAEQLADMIEQRQSAWLDQLGQPRRDAAVRQLVSVLPQQPVIDVAAAQRLTGKSHVTVGRALQQLEHAGVLNRLNERKWGRVWECDELFALVDSFEKRVRTRRQ